MARKAKKKIAAKKKTARKSPRVAKKTVNKRGAAKPKLLAGGNPQIAAYCSRRAQGGEVELPVLRRRGAGVVSRFPHVHELRESGVLPRHVAESCSTRRVEAQGRAVSRYPQG